MAADASRLVQLGDRYVALGLVWAARAAFHRAQLDQPDDPVPAQRLTELALVAGDVAGARAMAGQAVKLKGGADARLLSARAQLAAGESAAARFSFAQVLDMPGINAGQRLRALVGRAEVARVEGDGAGASAHVLAAFDELCRFAEDPASAAGDVEAELALIDELLVLATMVGVADEVDRRIDERQATSSIAPCRLLRALLYLHGQAQGARVRDDGLIEAEFEAALAARPKSRAIRLRLAEFRVGRRRNDEARRRAVAELEALADEMTGHTARPGDVACLARIQFLLGSLYADDPAQSDRAESAFREGLRLRPGHASAANQLALISLARGDVSRAVADIELALRIDSAHGLAWRSAARVLEAVSPGAALPALVGRILDAAWPGAGSAAGPVAPRLVTAMAEVARGDVLAGVYTRGHRLKNLLGIAAARARSARKVSDAASDVGQRLTDLERELTGLYDEWATYLRSMQAAGPRLENLPIAPLLAEVVATAGAASSVAIELKVNPGMPDVRGDRMLLREALHNLIGNAVDACAEGGGSVQVTARRVASGGAPVIEIEVTDSGPGIAPGDLPRLFSPGFTTKPSGSGIGLAVAERAVEAHHGRIVIDSEVGRGTRVTVLLPTDLAAFVAGGVGLGVGASS